MLPPLSQALTLAHQAIALSDPNPRVGCVITTPSGEILTQGHTQQAGGPHAEALAIQRAQAQCISLQGATAYVTLEPCSHHGRTPPCADALVQSGVAKVVVALLDPNPLVAGQGVARLRAAGMEVEVLPPDHALALEARELNIGFLSRMVRQRPWVRVKMAASLDGRTALPDGQSQWITGDAARADGHRWRARASAVLTGIGTVLADNPRMDVRAVPVALQPRRVVLDSQWRTPLTAAVLGDAPERLTVVGLADAAPERQAALRQAGVTVWPLPPQAPGQPHLAIDQLLTDLAASGVNELHVEAGAQLTGSFIEGGWADELLIYLAPKLLGPGRGMADMATLSALSQAPQFVWRDLALVGEDVRLLARRPGADVF
jgi:diaminohydroxyphosphoribosylaminopyrimidine deaminase/5-amino-6-(5-phosphoribosylamino)uracil reductase